MMFLLWFHFQVNNLHKGDQLTNRVIFLDKHQFTTNVEVFYNIIVHIEYT